MTSDDFEDIKAGVESLRKAMQSIQAARRELESMRDCNEKRGAEIALTHAEVMAAVAERLFSSALGRKSQGADKAIADPYANATMKDLEPEVE